MAGEAQRPRQFFILSMDALRFVPVSADNLALYIELTLQALWLPAWPGAAWFEHELNRLSGLPDPPAYLILEGMEPVGRVIVLQVDDLLIVRDLALLPLHGLAGRTVSALLQWAKDRQAHLVRAVVYDTVWDEFAALGFVEQKRRMTMHRGLGVEKSVPDRSARHVTPADVREIGRLLNAAYRGTVDDEGENLEVWTQHARDVLSGQYGRFLMAASFLYPAAPPYQSATLVVESAPGCAVLGQVVTHPLYANRGLARRLIASALAPLAGMGFTHWYLEVTLANLHAVHLYRSLGFTPLGPQNIYASLNC